MCPVACGPGGSCRSRLAARRARTPAGWRRSRRVGRRARFRGDTASSERPWSSGGTASPTCQRARCQRIDRDGRLGKLVWDTVDHRRVDALRVQAHAGRSRSARRWRAGCVGRARRASPRPHRALGRTQRPRPPLARAPGNSRSSPPSSDAVGFGPGRSGDPVVGELGGDDLISDASDAHSAPSRNDRRARRRRRATGSPNSSSTVVASARASPSAASTAGVLCPASTAATSCRLTPARAASSACVSPHSSRRSAAEIRSHCQDSVGCQDSGIDRT